MVAKHNFLPDKNVFILQNLYVLHVFLRDNKLCIY